MTLRLPPSIVENIWADAKRVSEKDMKVEQNHTDQTIAALANNHFGSGVIPNTLEQNVLFDSDSLSADQIALIAANIFDGTGVQVTTQPSDSNLGNQIEITLSDSDAKGRKCVKVAFVGLSFDGELHVERFSFYKNETQVTSKHYKQILSVFFNDFKGNSNCSRALGGRITIKEAKSFQISKDSVMVAQDVEPDIFWRDFKKANSISSLDSIIQSGIGSEYSVDALDINTSTGKAARILEASDVTTTYGQKFQAKTDNLQKVTLLLNVDPLTSVSDNHKFDWSGEIVVSIYPLQKSISCQSDILPSLPLDFDPATTPLAQISYNLEGLRNIGYLLNDVPTPVDFVFSNTSIGSAGGLTIDDYYVVTIKRSGSASQNRISVVVGSDKVDNSRLTIYSGGVWTDVAEEDMWFQVYTNSIKVASGQAYDAGIGIDLAKTVVDSITGATIDYEKRFYSFEDNGENVLNVAVLNAQVEQSFTTSDERTGNTSFSLQQYVPFVDMVSETGLAQLKSVGDPLILGAVKDSNPKTRPIIELTQTYPGLVANNIFCVIAPDADLLTSNLLGAKLIPNTANAGVQYKIVDVNICTDGYGAVIDGATITAADIVRASELIGESLSLSATQNRIVSGEVSTLEILRANVTGTGTVNATDVDLITAYVQKTSNSFPVGSSFSHLCIEVENITGRMDGYFNCDLNNNNDDGDGYVRLNNFEYVDINTLDINTIIYDGYNSAINIPLVDPTFNVVPFAPINYRVEFVDYWQPSLVNISSNSRLVPAAFVFDTEPVHGDCSLDASVACINKNDIDVSVDPGRVDFYIPGNLILSPTSSILNPDASSFKVDFEVGIVEIRLPEEVFSEAKINILDKFVFDRNNSGLTNAKYPAMKYSDCTYVQSGDQLLQRIRVSAAIQSIVKNNDGYDSEYGYSVNVSDIFAMVYDDTTGILTMTMSNLIDDTVYASLCSKIIITVYLKKAGFVNEPLTVASDEFVGLLSV